MSSESNRSLNRRLFLGVSAAAIGGLAAPAISQGVSSTAYDGAPSVAKRNISSFHAHDWRPYFSNTRNGAVLVDTNSRSLHYWSDDQRIYKLYPTSVPLTEELTRRGRTSVVQKVVAPTWRPTPNMRKRNPEWPAVVAGGAPDNPLGPLALYLGWTYYRIHGTHDTRKIGRQSSNGCIGLFNEHITELFALTRVGTQVLLI